MTEREIIDTFTKWRSKKKLTDVQTAVISRVLDIRYPNSIKMDIDRYVYLNYDAENIEIKLTTGSLYFDGNSIGPYHSWNLAKYDEFIPTLRKLILDRSQNPQVVAVRAVMDQFEDVSCVWSETIWGADLFVGSSKITVTISSNSADVELCKSKLKSVLATRDIAITNITAILDTILFYCKEADKNFVAPAVYSPAASTTSVFSSSTPKQVEPAGMREEDTGLAAAAGQSREQLSSNDCISVDEVIEILNSLATEAVDNPSDEFVDGWKEALSAAANKISTLHRIINK